MEDVGAVYLSMDNGHLGCESNHTKTWDWMTKHGGAADWQIVLEDDALLCEGFTQQLEQALTVAPTPIVGLYLGCSTPVHWQIPIGQAIQEADQRQAHWIITHSIINAVGVAIRTDLLPIQPPTGKPIDEALAQWCKTQGHTVGYTWPSLIDHKDEEPVIKKRADGMQRTQPRKAWRHGTRDTWSSKSVDMLPTWNNQ